ncbi:MAG: 4Fe-4S dicluster domain-containing protein [Verrucomicrobiota bacterium JB022]|nr:4Fe-4S dicluster domain-containing protein [Verrucomicrobiota bacterium JB022]
MPAPTSSSPRNTDEFPPEAAVWPSQLSRRRFLQVAGAGLSLATLSGCFRKPREEILPYVRQPEQVLPGTPNFYATTHNWRGYGRGILVESREGRPVKIEGNESHSSTLGASDAIMQASLLGLYDHQRLRAPHLRQRTSNWQSFEASWLERFTALQSTGGRGLWIVAEANASPTETAVWQRLVARFPQVRIVMESPIHHLHWEPIDYRFAAAEVVVGIDPDFLTEHPESLRYARDFAQRRRGWEKDAQLSRFYSLHAAPNVTNVQADAPLLARPSRWAVLLDALEGQMTGDLAEAEQKWVERCRADLNRAGSRALIVGGSYLDDELQERVRRLNQALGSEGTTWESIALPARTDDAVGLPLASRQELQEALEAEAVQALICFDTNPVHSVPELAAAITRAQWSACATLEVNETARACQWRLPVHHFLEDWGDLRSWTGTLSPVQPLIRPMYQSRSRLELLHWLAEPSNPLSAHDLVRRHWQAQVPGDFESWWLKGLQEGVFADAPPAPEVLRREAGRRPTREPGHGPLDLLVRLDPTIEDGRGARNAWLQELPKPISLLVWDQALWVSQRRAQELDLQQGDVVEIRVGDRRLHLPVLPLPAMEDDTVVAFLGYGRATARLHEGHHTGYSAATLQGQWRWEGVSLAKTGERYELVTTQHHQVMEGHEFVKVREVGHPAPKEEHHFDPEKSSFMPHPPKLPAGEAPYAWGMSIDLSSCIGCSACITACQAENNIPSVGKEQVAAGREMHWLRVDRYFSAESGPTRVLHQPVPCMHCEKAPCELVCPVAATVHDSEGLNAMVYNRCIGTRYCSNNCPYKVRRFNFLDYRPPQKHPRNLQFNPEVTVRERGVMEKCTYCVQRISRARIDARNEKREIRDGEIQTACQQACPTQAIVFGDISRPENAVAQRKAQKGDYGLLAELDTRPRTTYLPRWQNPPHEAR